MAEKKNQRRGPDHWRQVLAAQERSGLSVSRYARQTRLPLSTFIRWRRKLLDEETKPPVRFVELAAEASPAPRHRAATLRVGDVEVEFCDVPSAEYLAALVTAMSC